MNEIRVELEVNAHLPVRETPTSAGLTLFSPVSKMIPPKGSVEIDTGVHAFLPHESAGLIISDFGTIKLISEDDTDTIKVKVHNYGLQCKHIHKGMEIAKLVIVPVWYSRVEWR